MKSSRSFASAIAGALLMAGAGLAPAVHNARPAQAQTQPARRARDPFAPLLPLTGNKSQTKRRSGRMTDADREAIAKAEAKRHRKDRKRLIDGARSFMGYHPAATYADMMKRTRMSFQAAA